MDLNGNFKYIDTEEKLKQEANLIKDSKILGIDIECENSLHHYGIKIALMQISSVKKHWIIDLVSINDFNILKEILENKDILKIFHDVNFDFEILNYEYNCKPRNIFDTEKAAQLIGKENIGLASLLKEYFNVKKDKKFQKADWLKRPISKEMLSYAINDTTYLIKLYNKLVEELKNLGRYEWAREEMNFIENKKYLFSVPDFWSLKGLRLISSNQRFILKKFYDLREEIAKSINKPVHYIINSKLMLELAQNPPRDINGWKNLKRVHPIVKKKSKEFFDASLNKLNEEILMPKVEKKKFTPNQRKHIELLTNTRDEIASKIKIKPHLLMNKEQIYDIVITGKNNSLRGWQKQLFKI